MLPRIKSWSRGLKNEVRALYLAYRHPDTPNFAKIWAACVVAYAISPLDLIPDFIPVLGYLDDLILLPIGIWLAIKMIPPDVLAECRKKAAEQVEITSRSKWLVVIFIIIFWLSLTLSIAAIVFGLWL